MGANIKIGANTSDFQKQMKEMVRELKGLSSNFNLASTQAKLFGNATEQLKIKQESLNAKMKVQNKIIDLHKKSIDKLTDDIGKHLKKREELTKSIEEVNKKYKESAKATGKESEETKKLKQSLQELKEEYARNEKAIDSTNRKIDNANIKMDKAKTEILENKKALEEVDKKLKDIKLDSFTDKMDKVNKVSEKASNALRPAAVAVTGFGVASSVAAIKFEDGMAKVSTIADTTQVPLDDLKKGIMDLSNQTGISSEEIANNVYDAISAGQKTGDAVNFVSNSTKLAKAGFAEAGQSLDLLTTILNSYGMKASEVEKVSDVLINTQNVGKVTVGELSETMGKVIPTANAYKVNLQQLATGYAQLTSKGIKAAETTTYMNSMFNELGKTGTVAQKALKEATGKTFPQLMESGKSLGDVLNSMNKYAKKNNKSLADMFGSAEAGKAALVLSTNAGEDFNKILDSMGNTAGATKNAFDKVNNTTGNELKIALNEGKNALIGFGNVLAPFISLASKGLSGISRAFGGLNEGQKKAVVGLGAFIVGSYGILSVTSKVSGTLRDVVKDYKIFRTAMENLQVATKLQTAAQRVLNFVMEMSPVGKVILGIGLVVGALTFLYNHCEWFRNGVNNIFNGLLHFFTETVPSAFNKVINFFKEDWKEILLFIVNPFAGAFALAYKHCEGFRNNINRIFNGIKNFFVVSIPNFFKWLGAKFINFKNYSINKIKSFGNYLKTRIKNFLEELKFVFFNFPYILGLILGTIVGNIYKAGLAIKKFITKTIPETITFIKDWFSKLPGIIGTHLLNSYNKAKTWGSNMYQTAKKTGKDYVNGVINYIKTLPHKFKEKAIETYTEAKTWGSNMYQTAKKTGKDFIKSIIDYVKELPNKFANYLKEAWHKVTSWGSDLSNAGRESGKKLKTSIVEEIKSIPGKMKEIGKNIVHGIWEGITGSISWIKNKIHEFCYGIVDGFKSSLDIHSPSRVLRDQVGKFMAQGIGVGFTNEMDNVNLELKQSLNRTINTNIVPCISNVDLEKINSKLNNTTNNNIVVIVENTTSLDGETIGSKVYKKVAKKIHGDEKSYIVTKGKKGGLAYA